MSDATTTNGNGGVRISNREIYDKVLAIHDKVNLLDERVSLVTDHEGRLRTVERRVWSYPSIATLIAIAGLLFSLFQFSTDNGSKSTTPTPPVVVTTTTTTAPRVADPPTAVDPVVPTAGASTGGASVVPPTPSPVPPLPDLGLDGLVGSVLMQAFDGLARIAANVPI